MAARPKALGLVGGALLVAAAASAQPSSRVALRWTAPPECPAGPRVVAEVERILGDRGARPPKPLAVVADVTSEAGTYRVDLRTEGPDGPRTRTLQGKTCQALADATALVIALAIDPTVVPPAPPPAPEPAPAPGPAPAPAPAPAASSAAPAPPPKLPPKPPPKPRATDAPADAVSAAKKPATSAPGKPIVVSYRLRAWAGADGGSLPALAPAFGGEAGVVLAGFRLALGGEAFVSQEHLIQTSPRVGGTVGLAAGYGDVGYTFAFSDFEVIPIAGLEIGSLHAAGFGVTTTRSGISTWEAARLGARGAWFPTKRLGLTLGGGAAFPFARPSFVLTNVPGVVHRPSAAVGRFDAGVELRL